eukprot:516650_1
MVSTETLYMSLAVGLTVFGSIGNALGYVWQKKGHLIHIEENEIREIHDEELKSLVSNRVWLIGFIVCLIGSILTAAAFKFGAQSVLAPLSALVLVCNAILANKILGEPFTRNNLYGIILVIIGTIIAIIFGPKSTTKQITLEYVESCWRNHVFLIFFIVLTLFLFADFILVKAFEKKNEKSIATSSIIAHGADFLMVSYIALAAYCGSVNVLFMKSLMIFMGSFEAAYFRHYLFYITTIGIIVVNVTLEYFRQRAIKFFDATYVVPIFQVLLILGSSTMGAIFFDEFAALSDIQLTLFISAIGITVTGVGVLAFELGTVYKKMLKQINKRMPETFQFSKKENSLSVRSRARLSFTKKRPAKPKLVFPAFYGVTSAIDHYHMTSKLRIVIDDNIQMTNVSTNTPQDTDKNSSNEQLQYGGWNSPKERLKYGFPDTRAQTQRALNKSNKSTRDLNIVDEEDETIDGYIDINDNILVKAQPITPTEELLDNIEVSITLESENDKKENGININIDIEITHTNSERIEFKKYEEAHRMTPQAVKSFSPDDFDTDDFDPEELHAFAQIMTHEINENEESEELTINSI